MEPENENSEIKLRQIVVDNLRHPGGWIANRQFQNLLNKATSFSTTFSRPLDSEERQIKTGTVELVFGTAETARDAFTTLQKLIIDGVRPRTLVDPEFFKTEIPVSIRRFFEISDDQRLVYLLDAPKSVDEHLLSHFFQGVVPVHFQTLPMPTANRLFQVEVLLDSEDAAKHILAGPGKFPISEEDVECVVNIISPREYSIYSKMDEIREKASKKPTETHEEVQLAPEIDEDEITQRILEHIDEKRINLAEINEKDEVYAICDAISALYNGLPDSILKPAMGAALQKHLNQTEMHWLREHIEGLLRMWKAEMVSEVVYERASFVPMETLDYRPTFDGGDAKKEGAESKGSLKRRKAARTQMGVGAFLCANRERLIVESGEVDFDSDDDGNVMIGGEALSFDSWAKITKTKASGVVRANEDGSKKIGNGGLTKKQMRMARVVEGMDQDEYKKWRKEKSQNRRADIKQRIMNKGAIVVEDEEEQVGEQSEAVETNEEKKEKVLDEGEIDSEEERKEAQQAKRKKPSSDSSDSSSSSSSSSSSGGDGPVDARKRRKLRRKKDRKNPRVSSQPSLNPQVRHMFDNRKAIIAQMSPAHKAAFASALTQITQNSSSISPANASQVISSIMSGFKPVS